MVYLHMELCGREHGTRVEEFPLMLLFTQSAQFGDFHPKFNQYASNHGGYPLAKFLKARFSFHLAV